MLTKSELLQIAKMIKVLLEAELYDFRMDIKDLNDKIKYLPTSKQFFNETDKLYTKLSKIEQDRTVEASWKDQIEDHEIRLATVEGHLHTTPQ